jgi:hypothetical protein
MKETISLDSLFKQQEALKKKVEEAEKTLAGQNAGLRAFNDATKKQFARELLSDKTTGDPLTDEIVRWFGLDKNAIDKILAFNESLIKGKEILIAVSRQECIRHVMFSRPGCENEYATFTGYIYGLLSGEGLVIKQDGGKSRHTKITLPLKRYVKWNFRQGNTGIPLGGPLVVDGNTFNDLSADKLLTSIIDEPTDVSITERTIGRAVSPELPVIVIIISKPLTEGELLKKYGDVAMAIKYGQGNIRLATSTEKITGEHI